MYTELKLKISDNQKSKIQTAIQNEEEVTIRIDPNEPGEDILALTQTQIKKLRKGKPVNIKLSKTQLKHNLKVEGGFLGALAARALPAIASKVLPALGIGALTGLASTGVNKILGDGLYLKKGGNVCRIESDGKGLYLEPSNSNTIQGDGLFLSRNGEIIDGSGIFHDIAKNIPLLNILF
jgi:hypothetical protein